MKVGDKVHYRGPDSEHQDNCTVTGLAGPDEIFKIPVATLSEKDHWVMQSELISTEAE
jgi:hypothetical protein